MFGSEVGVRITFPVHQIYQKVQIVVFVFWNILKKKLAFDKATIDHRLEHGENVTAPLRFVGQQGARCVQHASWNQPTSAGLQAVRFGIIQNAVVAFARARFESEVSMRKIAGSGVQLRREIVAFWFALAAHKLSLCLALMKMMRDRPQIIEKLAEYWPALILLPNIPPNQARTFSFDRLLQSKAKALTLNEAQAFVRGTAFVHCHRRRSDPPLVDPAAICSVSINALSIQEIGLSHQAINGTPCGSFCQQERYLFGLSITMTNFFNNILEKRKSQSLPFAISM